MTYSYAFRVRIGDEDWQMDFEIKTTAGKLSAAWDQIGMLLLDAAHTIAGDGQKVYFNRRKLLDVHYIRGSKRKVR